MGAKNIWDGKQLPQVGDLVLIHLASADAWTPYEVTGFTIWPHLDGDSAYHRIFVDVSRKDGGVKVTNCRLLKDVRPLDWRDGDFYEHAKPTGPNSKPFTSCAAARDGECIHRLCPQVQDGEPQKSGRHCPLDLGEDE